MTDRLVHIAYPALILVLSLFFVYRLKIEKSREARGTGLIYTGLILIFIFTAVNLLQQHANYSDWFLEDVYPLIILFKFLILASGLVLFVVGMSLFFSHWGDKIIDVGNHLEKLRLLETIQGESRYPYPLQELLDRVLKNLVRGLGEEAGLIYRLDVSAGCFNPASAVGLNEDELALLKNHAFGRNIVSDALEDKTPLVTSDFRSFGGKAQLALSRFHSMLVIPLIAGKSKLGALMFFSPRSRVYDQDFLDIAVPIAGWLAEKIEVARLNRQLRREASELDTRDTLLAEFFRKIDRIVEAGAERPTANEFAIKCLGLAGADEVYLIGSDDGRLVHFGGTSDPTGLSESFRAAIITAIKRRRPVVLNQEESGPDGKKAVASSTVLYPVDRRGGALLLIRKKGAMKLGEKDLKVLNVVAALAAMIIRCEAVAVAESVRRKGLAILTRVLRLKLDPEQLPDDLKEFMNELLTTVSPSAMILLYGRHGRDYEVIHASVDSRAVADVSVTLGESSLGRAAALKAPDAAIGQGNVAATVNRYREENRIAFNALFGEHRGPVFYADYPVVLAGRTEYIFSVFDFEEAPGGDADRHRLLSLIVGLLNLRLEMARTVSAATPAVTTAGKPPTILAVAEQPVILDLLSSMCRSLGGKVLAAKNGTEGLNGFEAYRPDAVIIDLADIGLTEEIVVSDLARQGFSVWDLAARIKEISPSTMIIGVVGWGISPDQDRLRRAGIDRLLCKPFQIEQLAEILAIPNP